MHEAKAICKRLGKQLFEPTNYSDNYKVTALARAKGVTGFWIGIHDKTTEGEFTYESNGVTIGYKNWQSNEPNNHGKGEDCVQMNHGAWIDMPCTYKLSFVCERLPPGNLIRVRVCSINKFLFRSKVNHQKVLFNFWNHIHN